MSAPRRGLAVLLAVLVAVVLWGTAAGEASAQDAPAATPSSTAPANGPDIGDTLRAAACTVGGTFSPIAGAACAASQAGPAVAGAVGDAAAGVASDVAESAFGKIVKSALDGMSKAFVWAITFWLKIPTAAFGSGELAEKVSAHLHDVIWYALAASLLVAAVRLTSERTRGHGSEELFMLHARVVVMNSCLAAFIATGSRAGDAFSDWVIKESAGPDGPAAIKKLLAVGAFEKDIGMLTLLIGILGILGGLMQVVCVIIREVMLLFATSTLPVAAAASGMSVGSSSYDRLLKWTIACLLYKPIGALLYAIAFWAGNDAKDPMQVYVSIVALVLVALLLPMLVKLVAPAAAAAGTGMSGLAAGGMLLGLAAQAGGALATGGGSAAAGGAGALAGGVGQQAVTGQGFSQQGAMTPAYSGGPPPPQNGAQDAQLPSSGPGGATGGGERPGPGQTPGQGGQGGGPGPDPSAGPQGARPGTGGGGPLGEVTGNSDMPVHAVTVTGGDDAVVDRLDSLVSWAPTAGEIAR